MENLRMNGMDDGVTNESITGIYNLYAFFMKQTDNISEDELIIQTSS